MPRTVALDKQDFSDIREKNLFYIDKTAFIREWWKAGDRVTLITRPRRFGKTLMMSTVEHFFSNRYADRGDLFEGLDVWADEKMRGLQGTYPVIVLSLSDLKPGSFEELRKTFNWLITSLFSEWEEILVSDLDDAESEMYSAVLPGMDAATAKGAVKFLCGLLERHFGKKVIVLLDEYDTPMQEAWLKGFCSEMADFMSGFFNATFKANTHLNRAILIGVTRVSCESMFYDLDNLRVISTTTSKYETAFGFTEQEVFAAMDEYGLSDRAGVKKMYDGYTFGTVTDIYNPWSVLNLLKFGGRFDTWWANTSSNRLAGKLVREGSPELKKDFETLIEGGAIRTKLDEQIVFDQLVGNPAAVWSLLMASGYLKPIARNGSVYELMLTNGEVRETFEKLISGWFDSSRSRYDMFIRSLLDGDVEGMNEDINRLTHTMFSSFDTANGSDGLEPERFYHGFVLGLLVELRNRYRVTSNRESGRGRYDVMLEPLNPDSDDAIIIEFKVRKPTKEASLEETVATALSQIREKEYKQELVSRGIPESRIRCYGFAFEGKTVLIG